MVAKKTTASKNAGTKVSAKKKLSEGTTWAGLFTIAAAIATGGVSVLTDPALLTQIAGGIALVIAREG